ncbi:RagB/SusD family nutrient uptake outer membrane protein [Mucilaginibacter sp.]|uniref:RagB/SusD family nutrient uptake outer membrane protein n=1 Tax=Mucilaginibacter sp. TaxID=1882438 RepID=UPI00374CAE88
MKNIFLSITPLTLVLFFLTFTSCTKLKDTPYGSVDASTYNISSKDLDGFAINAYGNLKDYATSYQTDVCSDEWCIPGRPNGWVDGGVHQREHLHNFQATEEGEGWYSAYSGIQKCNQIIDFMIGQGRVTLPADESKRLIAEMKTLRAFYHGWVLDAYGSAPFVTKFSNATKPAQLSRVQLFDSIVADIKSAIPDLVAPSSTTYGRMHKYAAYFLLGRFYLNAKIYTGVDHWDDCIAVCDTIINSGKYILEPNFRDNFIVQNEGSRENILAVPFDTKNSTGFTRGQGSLHPANQPTYKMEQAGWGGPCAIPQFVDTYNPQDSRLKDTYVQGPQFAADGNPIKINIGTPTEQQLNIKNYLQDIYFSELEYGYRYGKYEYQIPLKIDMSNDFQVFRYAEVLFMKAESLLRTGHQNEAATLVTQVRQRAFKTNPAMATVTGAELMLGSAYKYGRYANGSNSTNEGGTDVVYGRMLDEWGWEFATEFRRRITQIRFGVFTTKSWLNHVPNGDTKKLFPIPLSEITQGYTQNPGY